MGNNRGVIAGMGKFWAWINARSVPVIFLMGIGFMIATPVVVYVVFFTILSGGSYQLYYTSAGAPRWLIFANAFGRSIFMAGTVVGFGLIALSGWRLILKAGRRLLSVKSPVPNQDGPSISN